MKRITYYVLGFLFDSKAKEVALIRKERPEWQYDKLNGIGGKIEAGETPKEAIRREFMEEAGVDVDNWQRFAILTGPGYKVFCFKAHSDKALKAAATKTDEAVEKWNVRSVVDCPEHVGALSNIPWLLLMAQDAGINGAAVKYN